MSFKLRIRGRDYFEPSSAANLANPLIPSVPEAELPGVVRTDTTGRVLTLHTISRLAGLAGIAASNDSANPITQQFVEPPGYEGSDWRLAGAEGLSQATLAKFRVASLALDASQVANDLSEVDSL